MNQEFSETRPGWEFLFTAELVLTSIRKIKSKYQELPIIAMGAKNHLSPEECSAFVDEKLDSLTNWVDYLKKMFDHDFNKAWGPPGIPGKKEDIRDVCQKFEIVLSSLLDWEESIWTSVPHPAWKPVFEKFRFSSLQIIEELEDFFARSERLFSQPDLTGKIELVFDVPFPRKLKGLNITIGQAIKNSSTSSDSFWNNLGIDIIKKLIGL